MVATPENTHCIIGAREQSAATDKKAVAIMVIEPVFRQGTTAQGIDNKETYLWCLGMKDTLNYGYYALNDCHITPMSVVPIE